MLQQRPNRPPAESTWRQRSHRQQESPITLIIVAPLANDPGRISGYLTDFLPDTIDRRPGFFLAWLCGVAKSVARDIVYRFAGSFGFFLKLHGSGFIDVADQDIDHTKLRRYQYDIIVLVKFNASPPAAAAVHIDRVGGHERT